MLMPAIAISAILISHVRPTPLPYKVKCRMQIQQNASIPFESLWFGILELWDIGSVPAGKDRFLLFPGGVTGSNPSYK